MYKKSFAVNHYLPVVHHHTASVDRLYSTAQWFFNLLYLAKVQIMELLISHFFSLSVTPCFLIQMFSSTSCSLYLFHNIISDWMVAFRVVIPLYMVMALSQFITYLLILIVGEKENKIKEGMKIMGLRDSVFW